VRQLALGAQGAGPLRIEWDGLRGDGTPAAPGTYGVRIEANIGGRLEALASAVQARVNSVSVSRDGAAPMLNIDGVGAVAMTDVIEIL
jgi:flagellar basal-body rod modification protein FlgD